MRPTQIRIQNRITIFSVVALILGVIGTIGGFIGATIAIVSGGIGSLVGAGGAVTAVEVGFLAIPFLLAGIVGAVLGMLKPLAGGILMLISGVGGFIMLADRAGGWVGVLIGFLFGAPLLIVGGILNLVGWRKSAKAVQEKELPEDNVWTNK